MKSDGLKNRNVYIMHCGQHAMDYQVPSGKNALLSTSAATVQVLPPCTEQSGGNKHRTTGLGRVCVQPDYGY